MDVVVEHAVVVAVLLEEPVGVVGGEVLELDEAAGAVLGDDGVHELVHELVVVAARDAVLAQADVERVGEQLAVVGAHVEHDRQTLVGVDARQRCVQREFAHGDAHAVAAQVAQA